jgi:hypothetical protein
MILRSRRGKATGLFDYDRARAAGADVNSENVNGAPRDFRKDLREPSYLSRQRWQVSDRPPKSWFERNRTA